MKEDIIKWAQEAGLYTILNEHAHEYGNGYFENTPYPELERFAALVRADEREACAKLIESHKTGANELMDAVRDMESRAIRARGQA
jgi:hypothetical protein